MELRAVNEQAEAGCEEEEMVLEMFWASQAERRNGRKGPGTRLKREFQVGDLVLVAYGKAVYLPMKLPAFRSRFYGPCFSRARGTRFTVWSPKDTVARVRIYMGDGCACVTLARSTSSKGSGEDSTLGLVWPKGWFIVGGSLGLLRGFC